MARQLRIPILGDRTASEYLSPEIAEQIAERNEHDRKSAVAERAADLKDP